jgi:hypothetical protein
MIDIILPIYCAGCFFTAGGLFSLFLREDLFPEDAAGWLEAVVLVAASWLSLVTMIAERED